MMNLRITTSKPPAAVDILLNGQALTIHPFDEEARLLIEGRYGSVNELTAVLRNPEGGQIAAMLFFAWVLLRRSLPGVSEEQLGEMLPFNGWEVAYMLGVASAASGFCEPPPGGHYH